MFQRQYKRETRNLSRHQHQAKCQPLISLSSKKKKNNLITFLRLYRSCADDLTKLYSGICCCCSCQLPCLAWSVSLHLAEHLEMENSFRGMSERSEGGMLRAFSWAVERLTFCTPASRSDIAPCPSFLSPGRPTSDVQIWKLNWVEPTMEISKANLHDSRLPGVGF